MLQIAAPGTTTLQSPTLVSTGPQLLQPEITLNIAAPGLHLPSQAQPLDLTRLNQKIMILFSQPTPIEDTLEKVFSKAVNGKTTNSEIAQQLGLTKEEEALVMNLDYGTSPSNQAGPITNKVTGEVYVSRSDLTSAILSNLGKIDLHKTVKPVISFFAKVLSGKKPDFSSIGLSVIQDNPLFFESILKELVGKHIAGTSTFSSFLRKALVALERGMDQTIAEIPNVQPLKSTTNSNTQIVPALVS